MKIRKTKKLIKLGSISLAIVLTLCGLSYIIRPYLRKPVPAPNADWIAQAKNVTIYRDKLGVPHIFGKSDRDTMFGLAYAHSQDDFNTIQTSLAAARGQLGLLQASRLAILNDYLVRFLNIEQKSQDQFANLLTQDFKEKLAGYAAGLNYYAALHPKEVDSRFLPYKPIDLVKGFIHKLSLFIGVGTTIEYLNDHSLDQLRVGSPLQNSYTSLMSWPFYRVPLVIGSNAHAVAAKRSTDGYTRLNINSHQPYEGPVAWYEAHLVSEDGWNMIGATFPGAPFILHGHNQTLGWAHTVNKPDGIDVYRLVMHPDGSSRYKFGDEWLPLIERDENITVDIGVSNVSLSKKFYDSVHGPVFAVNDQFFAIRYSGFDRSGLATEQWFRMNKAQNFSEWYKSMSLQGLPMMNTMYADQENIFYVYNFLLPERDQNFDWLSVLPGDEPRALWKNYIKFEDLPQLLNPSSGYLINTNSSPFKASSAEDNLNAEDYPKAHNISRAQNNRALRSHELFGSDTQISAEEFLKYKFDQTYSERSKLIKDIIKPLLKHYQARNENEAQALKLLESWDYIAAADSKAASIANLLYRNLFNDEGEQETLDPNMEFQNAVKFLVEHYGRVDVPLGELQLLRRGEKEWPLGGGVDLLNAVHTKVDGDRLVAVAGDSYIMVAAFGPDGVHSASRHQYGNVNRPQSKHYTDQGEAFVKHTLKPSLLDLKAIKENLESSYHPGDEL